jgi:Tol biopolymer transport system component
MVRKPSHVVSVAFPALLSLMALYSAPVQAARVVYLAEQRYSGLSELYLADTDAPGMPIQLNPPLPQISNGRFSNGVLSFAVSPDGARVAFSADQENVGDNDLYLVDIAAPGVLTRIGSLPDGHLELRSKFSPDGSKLVYTASDADFANTQLYLVDLSDPGTSIRLNGDLAQFGAVSQAGFQFTPDGTHVVYTASELEAKFELYAVDISAPGQSVRLNAPGGSVGDTHEGRFQILPDSRRVAYSAVWKNPGVRELHMVSLDQPGQPTTLNAPLQPAGYVFDFAVSPDGHYASYTADQVTDGKAEVFVVETSKPGISTRISGAVQSNSGLAQFTPDSQRLLYAADEERGIGDRDLYSAVIGTPVTRARVNAPLAGSFDIYSFVISPDAAHVVYRPEPPGGFATDLMLAKLDTPGSAIKLNGPLPDGAVEFRPIKFSPDGETLAFIAVESINDSIQELFVSRVSNPGSSIRLNGPLAPGGIVTPTPDAFEFVPEGPAFHINAGLSDAWYNPATNGQGMLMAVFPVIKQVFLAWFTYDTERPPGDATAHLGEPGHRWLTAQGPYEGDTAHLTIYVTEGGVFDAAEPAATTNQAGDGVMTVEFADCENGMVNYELTSLGISGNIPIQRIVLDNVPLCETLSTQ